jgi:hypothetical protein
VKPAFLILTTLWAGAILGLSFVATPVKFQAPSLVLPVALEIGRYTFRLFANVELLFLIASAAAACFARPRRLVALALGTAGVLLLLQRWWLLPELDQRVSRILAGAPVAFSSAHWLYAAFDAFKITLLVAAAVLEYLSSCTSRHSH